MGSFLFSRASNLQTAHGPNVRKLRRDCLLEKTYQPLVGLE